MKVDLYCIVGECNIDWNLGDAYHFSINDVAPINEHLKCGDADWVVFWDGNLGDPDTNLIMQLADTKADAWHAGLKLGLQGLPDMINYIEPAWLYNKDASNTIISSSFRLSLRACMVRRSVLVALSGLPSVYQSIEMTSLALGYKIIKSGGVIRYHPEMVKQEELQAVIPQQDEWRFLKQFFEKKWQYWVLLNKKGFWKNYIVWSRIQRGIYCDLMPFLHNSKVEVRGESINTSVSVLAPTLDRYSYLENELTQLERQTVKSIEVLITDQTDKIRRKGIDVSKYPGVTIQYFSQDENGQCIAWNKLLQEATGEYVLFLGDDADNIQPDFIEKLLDTANSFNADIVASNVVELKMPVKPVNHHYYMSDTFPITLAKKEVIIKAGRMDMFFNKNIRADYDLALRCHENGALMIFDSSALIDHHRAPVGGLREHKARVLTHKQSKQSISNFVEPTSSEIFLVKQHFEKKQYKSYLRIKYFNQLFIKGSLLKKMARVALFILKTPLFYKRYQRNLTIANAELVSRHAFRY